MPNTLIILHGWQSRKEKWQKVKELLESPDLRVIVPDLPGFKPETALDKPWTLDDYVSWLEGFIGKFWEGQTFPELGKVCPSQAYLLGHSFGGRIAIKFAARHPETLKGLILVSAAGIKKKKTFWDRFLLAVIKLARKLGVEETTQGRTLWQVLRKATYKYVLRKTDYLTANPLQKKIMKNALEEDLKPLLKEISVPTLIIWGKKDKVTLLKDGYLMKEGIKDSRFEVLENIGHTPHLENPELLAKKIKEFI